MNIELLPGRYEVRKLTDKDTDGIYRLCSGNLLYYQYCPPFVTRQSILEDMEALPPGRDITDKHYVGFFHKGKMIAVLDFIDGYPEKTAGYIGFFMVDLSVQSQGIGSSIIGDLCKYLEESGCRSVRLAWVKGNPQAERFWRKNGFIPVMEAKSDTAGNVIVAERRF